MAGEPKQKAFFIDVSKGVEESVADSLLPFGYLIEAENCEYTHRGELAKRAGYARLSSGGTAPLGQFSLTDAGGPFQVANYRGQPVYISGSSISKPLITYNPSTNTLFEPKGSQYSAANGVRANIGVRRSRFEAEWPSSSTSDHETDTAYTADGVICHVYRSDTYTFRTVFTDGATGEKIAEVSTAVTAATAPAPRVVALQDAALSNWHIIVFYNDNGTLKYKRWLITGNTWSSTAATASGTVGAMGGSRLFDVHVPVPAGTAQYNVRIIYQDSAAPTTTLQFATWTLSGGVDTITTISTVTANVTMYVAFLADLGGAGNTRTFIATAGVTNGVVAYALNAGTGAIVTTMTIDAGAIVRVRKITGATCSNDTAGEVRLLYTVGDATTVLNDITYSAEKRTGIAVSTNAWGRSLSLCSRLFWDTLYDSGALTGFVVVSHDTPVNGAYYVMHFDLTEGASIGGNRTPQAVLMPRSGGVAPAGVVRVGNASYNHRFAGIFWRKQRIESVAAASSITYVPERMDLDFHPTKMLGNPQSVADWLVTPGGQPRIFDGNYYGEMGFVQQPEVGTGVAAGGGSMTGGGAYTYHHVFEWTDGQNRVHRSSPSAAYAITLGGGDSKVTYTMPTCRVGTPYIVKMKVFRNEASGTLFYLVGVVDNANSVDTMDFVDTIADSALISGELLYTTGGEGEELPNITPPAFSSVVEWRGHIVGIGEKPNEIWLSKNIVLGHAPGFSESLVIDMSAAVEATGLAVFDDRLFVTTRDSVYQIIGEPPDDTGAGDMPKAFKVANRGTEYPRSIAVFDGIYFAATKQIIKLDRGLQAAPLTGIDDWVDSLNLDGDTVTPAYANGVMTAVVLPNKRQIRWYHGSGSMAFYDIDRGAWTRGALASAGTAGYVTAACEYNSAVAATLNFAGALLVAGERFLIEDQSLRGEDGYLAGNDGTKFWQTVRLPWFGDRGAGQRIHAVEVRAIQGGAHSMILSEYIDYNETTAAESRKRANSETAGLPVRVHYEPKYHQCEVFQLRLSDGGATTQTRGFNLIGVGIVYSPRTPGSSLPDSAGTEAYAGDGGGGVG